MQMNLKTYLCSTNQTFKKLGERLGVSPIYLGAISSGRIIPSKRLAQDIEKATNGVIRVKFSDKKRTPPRKPKICDRCKCEFYESTTNSVIKARTNSNNSPEGSGSL